MDFKVLLSREAVSDLKRIAAYIVTHKPLALQRMGNRLLDAALSLQTFPERGRMVARFRGPGWREMILRTDRVIFRVKSSAAGVEIVRFCHGARGFPHIPREPEP